MLRKNKPCGDERFFVKKLLFEEEKATSKVFCARHKNMKHNQKWKKMNGYKEPEPPDCSSSMKEWEESIKKYQK